MIAVARPVLWIGLALAALAGFLVGGIGGVVGCLPRKGLRMLKRIAIVAGCAMLASLFAVMAFRTWSMETPDLPYVPPILAGLLGGVIVLLHETGAKALSKADVDSKNHAKATKHNNRISKIDRLWRRVCFVTWLLAAGLIYWPVLRWARGKPEDFVLWAFLSLVDGAIVMFYFVGIPLRIALNLIFKERQPQRLWETVMCVIVFFVMSVVAYMSIWGIRSRR